MNTLYLQYPDLRQAHRRFLLTLAERYFYYCRLANDSREADEHAFWRHQAARQCRSLCAMTPKEARGW